MHKEYQKYIIERRELAQTYGELYPRLIDAFYEVDPMRIAPYGVPHDEYAFEVGTVIPRLSGCTSIDDVETVLWQEFLHWFGASALPPVWMMERLAVRVWGVLGRFGGREMAIRK